jgi:nitrogen fixation protein FixH
MVVVIVVNGVLVAFAIGTFPGLETQDHYRKGLAYNDNLALTRAQVERGWHMDLAFTADPSVDGRERRGRLDVTFRDREGRPLDDLSVNAILVRPTHEGHDVSVALRPRGAGLYGSPVVVALPGQWEARILANRHGDTFQETRRFLAP